MNIESPFDLHDTVYFIIRSVYGGFGIHKGIVSEITLYDHRRKGPAFRYIVSKIYQYISGDWHLCMFPRMSVDIVYASLEEVLNDTRIKSQGVDNAL